MALTGKRVNCLEMYRKLIANAATEETRERKKIETIQRGVLMIWCFEKCRIFDKLVPRVPT